MKTIQLSIFALILLSLQNTWAKENLELEAQLGFGFNNNVYRTPDKVYFDYFAGNTPAQNLQSGTYVPMELDGKYIIPGENKLQFDYKLDGEFYTDGNLSNGNSVEQDISGTIVKKTGSKSDRKIAQGRVFFHHKNKDYYDRDDGTDKISGGGEDLTDRFSYTSLGGEGSYAFRKGVLEYEFGGLLEQRNYAPVVAISEYDYTELGLFLGAEYRFSRGNMLKIQYDLSTVDFKDREARDLTGSQAGIRPKLHYLYNEIKFTLRNKFSANWVSRLSYQFSHRIDGDVGYNDRIRHSMAANLIYRADKLRNKFRLAYVIDDYARAWAFDTDASGITKDYDSLLLKWALDYEIAKSWFLSADVEYRDTNSNDTRYDYERYKMQTGIKWIM